MSRRRDPLFVRPLAERCLDRLVFRDAAVTQLVVAVLQMRRELVDRVGADRLSR
jgi:hypothetical protein